jgi:hypothetical protein
MEVPEEVIAFSMRKLISTKRLSPPTSAESN